jgi:hypothetical protein
VWAVPKKWPPGATSRSDSKASESSSTTNGPIHARIMSISSASSTDFSNDAVSPPSSQPVA